MPKFVVTETKWINIEAKDEQEAVNKAFEQPLKEWSTETETKQEVNILKIHPEANKDVRFEFEARNKGEVPKEIEVYIGGWFLCSVNISDISEQARDYLFDENAIY